MRGQQGGVIVLDWSAPLLLIEWHGLVADMPTLTEYFDVLEDTFDALDEAGERCVVLTYSDGEGRPPAHVRRYIGERMKASYPQVERIRIAQAMVVLKPGVRAFMKVLGFVDARMRQPMFATMEEGREWVRETLAAEGLPIPSSLDRPYEPPGAVGT